MADQPKRSVELVPASVWTCPDCGVDQFERSVALEASPDEVADLKRELGVEPWQEGVFLTDTPIVTCHNCGAMFDTVGYQNDVEA